MSTRIFYARSVGDIVVDDKCVCGHRKSDHGSVLTPLPHGKKLRIPHDGNCCTRKCVCRAFQWAGWYTATEAAQKRKKGAVLK
jgi:hypothetical protein